MHLSSSQKYRTRNLLPGTPLKLDWGSGRCRAEAIAVGGEHALILSPKTLSPGTRLVMENGDTGEETRLSVVWCGTAEPDGLCKLGLQVVGDEADPGPAATNH